MVRLANGRPLPVSNAVGFIVLPAGIRGPAFLVYANFRIITEWNKSLFYALFVGHLSDRLVGKKGLVGKSPPGGQSAVHQRAEGRAGGPQRLGVRCGRAGRHGRHPDTLGTTRLSKIPRHPRRRLSDPEVGGVAARKSRCQFREGPRTDLIGSRFPDPTSEQRSTEIPDYG